MYYRTILCSISYIGGTGVLSEDFSRNVTVPFSFDSLSSKFNGGILSVDLGLTWPNLYKIIFQIINKNNEINK